MGEASSQLGQVRKQLAGEGHLLKTLPAVRSQILHGKEIWTHPRVPYNTGFGGFCWLDGFSPLDPKTLAQSRPLILNIVF